MAGEGQVIACHKRDELDAELAKAKESGKLVVVDFTASWCGPCRSIAPYFSELAKDHPDVVFLKVDVDELQAVAVEWEINAMPTFVFLKGGVTILKSVGAGRGLLLKKVEELKTPAAATSTA